MTRDLTAELQNRLRASRRKLIWPQLKQALEDIFGEEFKPDRLVPFDKSDALKDEFGERLRQHRDLRRITRPPTNTEDLWSYVNRLAVITSGVDAVLFHRLDQETGGLRVDAGRVLAHARRVWAAVGRDDLELVTEGSRDGLCFDFVHGGPVWGDYYELQCWGVFDNDPPATEPMRLPS